MPEPIEYEIVKHIQAALAAISIASGYHYTVQATVVKIDPNEALHEIEAPGGLRPFIILEVIPEIWDYSEQGGGVRLIMPVRVHWVSDSVPTDDNSRLNVYFKGCSDVEQAVAVDVTRGQKASDTRVVRRELDLTRDSAEVWARIDLEVRLRRVFGQPNG